MKKCSHCHELKLSRDFPKRTTQKDGLNYNCRKCSLQQGKESKYRMRYGITLEKKWNMLKAQNGKCAVCNDFIEGKACVDHDHQTNKIRAILCDKCNRGLGVFNDDIRVLKQAIIYLQKWQDDSREA